MITKKELLERGYTAGYPMLNGRGSTPFMSPEGVPFTFDVNYIHFGGRDNIRFPSDNHARVDTIEELEKLIKKKR